VNTALNTQEKGQATSVLLDAGISLMEMNISRKLGKNASPGRIKHEWRLWLSRKNDPIPGDVSGPIRIHYQKQ